MPNYCKGEACVRRKKRAHYGPKGGKRQWCGTCAKTHGGVRLGKGQMCEFCPEKHAH